VCLFSFGLGEGIVEGFVGHVALYAWGGHACLGVGLAAVIIPPADTLWVRALFCFEGLVAGFLDHGVKVFDCSIEVVVDVVFPK